MQLDRSDSLDIDNSNIVCYRIYCYEYEGQNKDLYQNILAKAQSIIGSYIWASEGFNLHDTKDSQDILAYQSNKESSMNIQQDHFWGSTLFGDNIDDEWFIVFILTQISIAYPQVAAQVWDNDGEFILIESSYKIPPTINPDNSAYKTWIKNGSFCFLKFKQSPGKPQLGFEQIRELIKNNSISEKTSQGINEAVQDRLMQLPQLNFQNGTLIKRLPVPYKVASILLESPNLISQIVEAIAERDEIDSRNVRKLINFKPLNSQDFVSVPVPMNRLHYAQLQLLRFEKPKAYPQPADQYSNLFDMGMKIVCGLEISYCNSSQRKQEFDQQISGSASEGWGKFLESLEKLKYFGDLERGCYEYNLKLKLAEDTYFGSIKTKPDLKFKRNVASICDDILQSKSQEEMVGTINQYVAEIDQNPIYKEEYINKSDKEFVCMVDKQLEQQIQARHNQLQNYYAQQDGDQNRSRSSNQNGSNHTFSDQNQNNKSQQDKDQKRIIQQTMEQFINQESSYEGVEGTNNEDMVLDMNKVMRKLQGVLNIDDSNFKQMLDNDGNGKNKKHYSQTTSNTTSEDDDGSIFDSMDYDIEQTQDQKAKDNNEYRQSQEPIKGDGTQSNGAKQQDKDLDQAIVFRDGQTYSDKKQVLAYRSDGRNKRQKQVLDNSTKSKYSNPQNFVQQDSIEDGKMNGQLGDGGGTRKAESNDDQHWEASTVTDSDDESQDASEDPQHFMSLYNRAIMQQLSNSYVSNVIHDPSAPKKGGSDEIDIDALLNEDDGLDFDPEVVNNLLQSVQHEQGGAGPAGNMLQMMGINPYNKEG